MRYRKIADIIFGAGLEMLKAKGVDSHIPTLFLIHGEDQVEGVIINVDGEFWSKIVPLLVEAKKPKAAVFVSEAHMATAPGGLSVLPSQDPSSVDTFTAWYADDKHVRFRMAVLKQTESGKVEITEDTGWAKNFGGRFRDIAEEVKKMIRRF